MTCHFVGGTANNILFSSQKVKKKKKEYKKGRRRKKKKAARQQSLSYYMQWENPLYGSIYGTSECKLSTQI